MSEREIAARCVNGGKKVFFLYPHSVIRDEMLDILIMNGFETYTLSDHKRAVKILERFPGSIVFINIDEGMPEGEWEAYIRAIHENPETKDTMTGILSYNQDKALMEKYLTEIAVPCGYIQLKQGIRQSAEIILNTLQANEARGRRKYIRTFCENDVYATLDYKCEQGLFQGQIIDISSAGIAARFSAFPDILPNSLLREVQIKLHGALLSADMILFGERRDDTDIWILLFDPSRVTSANKAAVHHYIKQNLQKYIDTLTV